MVNETYLSLLLQELVEEVYALKKEKHPFKEKTIEAEKQAHLRRIRDTLFSEE